MRGRQLLGAGRVRARAGGAAAAAAAVLVTLLAAPAAHGHAVHTAKPGESLWSIAAANGTTAATIAAANDLPADSWLTIGQRVRIPESVGTGAPLDPATAAALGMVAVHHPSETPYLAPEAAAAWEAMREESLATYGVDLYPIGARSGYRTYEQQAYFYDQYLSGEGARANPPGTSSHETGNAVDLATPEMRDVVDEIGAKYGWQKVEAPTEWWHINYVGGYGG